MPKYKDCHAFITGLGIAVPPYRIAQEVIGRFMKRHMMSQKPIARQIDRLTRQSLIDYRYTVVKDYALEPEYFTFYPPKEDLEPFPTVSRRMQLYREAAPELGAQAAVECLAEAEVAPSDVTHLICVSCTGMYAPGLDIDLVERLGLSHSVARTSILFMGCYAAFNALKAASAIVAENPGARVLIVCVELCSLHFQKHEGENSRLLSNMLFGDGVSAAMVENRRPKQRKAIGLVHFLCDLFPEGKDDMTWEIADWGFVMKLSSSVPEVLRDGLPRMIGKLLRESGCTGEEFRHFAIHPGGPRILETVEQVMGLNREDNRWAYEILRDYGNMSSATLFFVLHRLIGHENSSDGDLIYAAAFGPGLTCESALLRVSV